ncbi:MAG: hypothetical protein HRU35_02125 [Rickettsiaceae bacterium]|nr:hypothetical protein [Rickettsiaceae bacterium]
MAKTKNAELLYELATKYYNKLNYYLDNNKYKAYDLSASISTDLMWLAFVIGHPKAAYGLHLAFKEGTGVTENEYFATFMYGIAKKLNNYREDPSIEIPSSMNSQIDRVYNLFMESHNKYYGNDLSSGVLTEQQELFKNEIVLPNKQTILNYLLQSDNGLSDITDGFVNLSGDNQDNTSNDPTDGCCIVL